MTHHCFLLYQICPMKGLEDVCLLQKKLIFGTDLISKVEEFVKCVCNDPVSDKNFGTI